MKIKLSEERIIAPWKTRIIALMQTRYVDGVSVGDVMKVYPDAPMKYIEKAIEQLVKEKLADKVE